MKVGRTALDRDAMDRLEQQYPEIIFDWDRILREPPQTLTEQEALRRNEQRHARDARRRRKRPAEEPAEFAGQDSGAVQDAEASEETAGRSVESMEAQHRTAVEASLADDALEDSAGDPDVITSGGVEEERGEAAGTNPGETREGKRRRRKRRRGKKRDGGPSSKPPSGTPPTSSV